MTTSRLPIPDGVLKQHTIILGKTGSGKSSVGRLLVEHILEPHATGALLGLPRVTIVDPKGDWWGIKSSATGRDGGLPVAIFGGEHAEVPITPNSGAAVAKIATETSVPILIDLGDWMVSEKTRFFLDFAPVYYRATGPRYLMVDEAHQFCPKGKIPDPQVGKMLHWMNTIAGEGRGRGITLIAASQRPQKVHNDFLTQCETLIAMRVIHPADMRAYRDWIDGCGDPRLGSEIMASVAALPKGSAWVWSPEIGFGPTRVAFPKYWTYDSFKPQERTMTLQGWHEVDLGALRAQFAQEIRQAEENDPRTLHKRIRELEAKLAAKAVTTDVITGPTAEQARAEFDRGVELTLAEAAMARKADRIITRDLLSPLIGIIDGVRSRMVDYCETLLREPGAIPRPTAPKPAVADRKRLENLEHARAVRSVQGSPAGPSPSGLARGQQKILNALAWLKSMGVAEPRREQVSAIANYRGGAFTRALAKLKTDAYVAYTLDGCVHLTVHGTAHAAVDNDTMRMEDRWFASLQTEGQRKIFTALIGSADEGPITREALSELADYRGGAFTRSLAKLKTMGAVEYLGGGQVALSRLVRP